MQGLSDEHERTAPRPEDPVEAALAFLEARQGSAGSWPGDYGGPMFLLPLFVFATRTVNHEIDARRRDGMIRYLSHHQNGDGGWGLHVEATSYVFTTALSYVALRMLGIPADDARCRAARAFLSPRGGPLASASWGKFFLALVGLYDYRGMNPVPPELWLLPEALPVHPSRLWCHCRMVYLPMSYLYGARAHSPSDPLIEALKRELYPEPYEQIDWPSYRNRVAPEDRYVAPSPLLRAVNSALLGYERAPSPALRRRALDFVVDQVRREDENTHFICIGPINKLLNMLVWHFERPQGIEVRRHRERLEDYLYEAADGIKMNGYNSSELWDTTFAVQAICAAGRTGRTRPMLERAHRYIETNQVLEDVPERERAYRDPSRGGWPFSNRPHGWPITDCTAEGLKASLLLEPCVTDPISKERLTDAAELLLYFQNPNGGWSSYERMRGPAWLEKLNPSDCFSDIMVDYPYVECTSACIQALAAFDTRYPGALSDRIEVAIERGVRFLLGEQRPDGSFEGSWGVCFTYGTWFGVRGLRAGGLSVDHPAIRRAVLFLESHQHADGGWGESIDSCREGRYVPTETGQAVMTGWALLALLAAGERKSPAVERGLAFLRSRQLPDGSFPTERVAGVFNKTCAIHYDNYLKVFPLWALGAADAEGRG